MSIWVYLFEIGNSLAKHVALRRRFAATFNVAKGLRRTCFPKDTPHGTLFRLFVNQSLPMTSLRYDHKGVKSAMCVTMEFLVATAQR